METTKRGLDVSNPEHIIYTHSGIDIAVLVKPEFYTLEVS